MTLLVSSLSPLCPLQLASGRIGSGTRKPRKVRKVSPPLVGGFGGFCTLEPHGDGPSPIPWKLVVANNELSEGQRDSTAGEALLLHAVNHV